MSSPTQPRTVDGRFGTVDHPADPGVYLAGPTTDDLALSAQLDAEVRSASAAQARVQLLLVEFAADGVLRQWPEAAYLQMDYSDQEYGAMVPVAVLDADGQELDDGMELWDDLDNGADLSQPGRQSERRGRRLVGLPDALQRHRTARRAVARAWTSSQRPRSPRSASARQPPG